MGRHKDARWVISEGMGCAWRLSWFGVRKKFTGGGSSCAACDENGSGGVNASGYREIVHF